MVTSIFKKAKRMHYAQNPTRTGGITRKDVKTEYYTVTDDESQKEHEIKLETTQSGTTIDCPCTARSLQADKPTLCSHAITLILYLTGREKIK